jgi:hypothetical protein
LPMSSVILQGYMTYILYFRAKYAGPQKASATVDPTLSSMPTNITL